MKDPIRYALFVLLIMLAGCLEPDRENLWSLDNVVVVDTEGYCRGVDLCDSLAFVAAGQGGVQVWDLAPLYLSGAPPLLNTRLRLKTDLAVSKDIKQVAYLPLTGQIVALETDERPLLIDYTNPLQPECSGQVMSEKSMEFRVVDGQQEFTIIVADDDDGIKITHFIGYPIDDTTVLYSPDSDVEFALDGSLTGLDRHDSLLAVSRDQLGVALLRYRGPGQNPLLLDEKDTEGTAESVTFTAAGDLYVAANEGGAYYFTVAADTLRLVTRFARDLHVLQIACTDEVAALALGSYGLALYDISDPDRPESRGVFELGYVYRVLLADGYLFAATRTGLQIFTIDF